MGSTSGCTATVQTLESGGHGGDVWLYWVIEVSYTDKGNDGVPALTGSSTVILQTKHRQAEHFNNTGRIPGTTSTGDPGVVVETTSDTAGGTSNIGYVEPGDWISFDRVNLKDITALSMRMAGTVGADFEVRWNDPVTGALLGTVPAKPTSGWQVFDDSQTNLAGVTDETGTLYLVAKKDGQNGSVVNVNWIDFIGKGATVNQRPDITSASVTPTTGTAPVTVQLAAAATDPEGENVAYQWDMGTTAGEKVSGATGSFTYVTPGTYTVTLTATDAKGAYGTRTFEVKVQPAAPTCLGAKSDDFDGTALDSARWSVIRPDGNLTVAGGKLVIPTAPADIYSSTNNAPNIVLQPMPAGAWEITTKVTGAMYTAYQQAGLVVYGDDDNYAKLVFSGRSSSGDKAARIIQFSHEQGGGAAQEANTAGLGTDFPDTVWLRLASDGTNLTPSYSTDGITWKSADDSWTGWSTVRKSTAAFTNPRVGLLSLANSGVAVDASFEYFYLTPDDSGTGSGPSDEFDGAKLADCIWTVIRPDGKITVADGSLTLPAAATDLYQTTNTAGNLVLQNLPDGAWEVTTKVTGAVSQAYAQGGILVYGDDDNYLKLVFEGRSTSADKAARIIQFSHEKNATAAEANSPNLGAGFPDTVWLRLTSDGSTVTPSYSADGTTWIAASNSWTGWSAIDKTTTGLNKIGLVAMGTSGTTTPANVSFDFFHLTGEEPTEDTTTPVTTATVSTADPAVVTLTAADEAGGSGIAKTEYRIGTQTWSTYTAPVSVARTDVDQTIEFRSTDKAGNVEDTKSATITKSADTTAPVTTATLNPASPSGENGWWNEQVTLTLSATDAKSGVASTQFALGDGEWQNYTAPVVIDVEGAQSITFRSTDVAGNVEATKSVEVKVDTIAPLVAANVEGNDPVTITVVASDETSGIAGREYKIGAGDWQSYSVPFTVARTATVQTVQFRATDKAGNTAATGSVVVPAAPVVQKPSVTGLSVSPASLPYGGTVTASITVTSAGSVGREVVALYDGNELIGAGVLKAGKVAITAEDLSIGSHPLKAVFAGSATVAGSESVVKTVNVAKATSAVGLKASAVTQAYGTAGPVKLTATVTLSSGLPAAGQVRFKDGSAVLATVPVISGKAGVKLSQTAKVGKHPITAQFLPADPTTTVGSTSQTVTITVTKATSIIKLKAGATTVGKGKAIAFATTISLNTKQSPAGSVKFVVDGKTAKTVKVSGSSATYTLPGTTKAGKHTIKAVFVPTSASTVTGSSSSTVTVTITA
jgi:regulation of enolase protein 1 (concanavalin A-like superfamily)